MGQRVADLMDRETVCLGRGAPVRAAISLIAYHHVRAIVVLDEARKPIGTITADELFSLEPVEQAARLPEGCMHPSRMAAIQRDSDGRTADSIAVHAPALGPSDGKADAIRAFLSSGASAIAVTGADGEIHGVVRREALQRPHEHEGTSGVVRMLHPAS